MKGKTKIDKMDLTKRLNSGIFGRELAELYGVAESNIKQMLNRMVLNGDISKVTFVGWWQKKGVRKGEKEFNKIIKNNNKILDK
jgi:hypothetical protein